MFRGAKFIVRESKSFNSRSKDGVVFPDVDGSTPDNSSDFSRTRSSYLKSRTFFCYVCGYRGLFFFSQLGEIRSPGSTDYYRNNDKYQIAYDKYRNFLFNLKFLTDYKPDYQKPVEYIGNNKSQDTGPGFCIKKGNKKYNGETKVIPKFLVEKYRFYIFVFHF